MGGSVLNESADDHRRLTLINGAIFETLAVNFFGPVQRIRDFQQLSAWGLGLDDCRSGLRLRSTVTAARTNPLITAGYRQQKSRPL